MERVPQLIVRKGPHHRVGNAEVAVELGGVELQDGRVADEHSLRCAGAGKLSKAQLASFLVAEGRALGKRAWRGLDWL